MAVGAGARADGGAAGGGGGGDGRGPSGGSSSSGGRSLRGECSSVSLRLRAEAVPKAARSVPARKGPCLGSEGTALVPGRRGRRPAADGEVAGVRLGMRRRRQQRTGRSPCTQRRAGLCAAVPGAAARGVAPGAGRAVVGGGGGGLADSGLLAPRGGTRRSQDAGKPLPRFWCVFTGLRGCDCPWVDVRAASQNWRGSRPVDGCSQGEKLDCPGKFLILDQTGIAL